MSAHRTSHRCAVSAATFLAATLAASAVAAPPQLQTDSASMSVAGHYRYRTLDVPGAIETRLWGLNDFGTLSGQYTNEGQPAHAMVYRFGHFKTLDPDGLFGDRFAAAGGPNDLGVLFGGYTDASTLQQRGFVLQWGWPETVDFSGHLNSNVDGVNVWGAIAGVYWDADGADHGVLRRNGHDTPIDFPDARDTYPLGISDNGEMVGFWDNNPYLTHGFYRSANGTYTSIDVPIAGTAGTAAFAINGNGQIACYYYDASAHFHGFVKTGDRYEVLDVPGATSTYATAMNDFGAVAGYYADAAGKKHGFVATPW